MTSDAKREWFLYGTRPPGWKDRLAAVPMAAVCLALALGMLFANRWAVSARPAFGLSMTEPPGKGGTSVVLGWTLVALGWLVALLPPVARSWKCRRLPSVMVMLSAFWLGLSLMTDAHRRVECPRLPSRLVACVEVLEPVREKPKSVQCRVEVTAASEPWVGKRLQLALPKSPASMALSPGNQLLVALRPDSVRNFGDGSFDYASYMKHLGFCATGYVPEGAWRQVPEGRTRYSASTLRGRAEALRSRLVSVYVRYGIEDEPLALVSALTLGKKDLMDADQRREFASAGVAHVLAVSGMHVGIVSQLIGGVFSALGAVADWLAARWPRGRPIRSARPLRGGPKQSGSRKGRPARGGSREGRPYRMRGRRRFQNATLLLTALLLWMYALLTGFSASVLRAVAMFSLAAVGRCLGRKSNTWNNVFLTAFLMLCLNPFYLFDVGFQLSFLAVMSILLLLPYFQARLLLPEEKRLARPVNWLLNMMALSVAAQIGTSPLSIACFHQFPNYFLLTNLTMVPLAVGITYLAVALLALSAWPVVAQPLGWLLGKALGLFCGIASRVDAWPGAVSENLYPSTAETLIAYALLFGVLWLSANKAYIYGLNKRMMFHRQSRYDLRNY